MITKPYDILTRDQAQALHRTHWWEWDGISNHDVVFVQLFLTRAIMPFGLFMEKLGQELESAPSEVSLVFAYDLRVREFLKGAPTPTPGEVLARIPEACRIAAGVPTPTRPTTPKRVQELLSMLRADLESDEERFPLDGEHWRAFEYIAHKVRT